MEELTWVRSLLFSVAFLRVICCEMLVGIKGENFTFEVKVDQHMSEILWRKNKDKIAEWGGQDPVIYFTSLRGRGLLNTENGILTIFDLQKNDSADYMLEYVDSEKKVHSLTYVLAVKDPFPEPEISCNITANDTKLRCTTDFHQPMSYRWKIGSMTSLSEAQEISISKNLDPSTRVTCSIKFSQTEKSSQINLTSCSQAEEVMNNSSGYGIICGCIGAAITLVMLVGLLSYLYSKGKIPLGRGRAALNSSADGVDNNLDKADRPMTDEHVMKNGVNQNDTLKENSSLLDKHADSCGVNGGGMTQGGEGVSGEHLRNSHPH